MQKNWYILYTKAKCEKKVSNLLSKRKIENFCPHNRREVQHIRKIKTVFEPLFPSYVFIKIEEQRLPEIVQFDYVHNLVYWKGSPAIVADEEIRIIRNFVSDHRNVKLEKSKVNLDAMPNIVDRPAYKLDGHILTLKTQSIKINLPSVGYTLVAEFKEEKVLGNEFNFVNQSLLLQ